MAETPPELQTEIEKLERKHAENPEGRYFVPLANAYRKLGRLEASESLLREGLGLHPEYLSAHIVLGRCLAERGASDEAAEEFRYVLSLDPQNLVALRSLGDISLAAGRAEEARSWFGELLAADPMNEEARRTLESLPVEPVAPDPDLGESAEDDEVYDGALDLEEESPELVTETIAELYDRQGFHARAAEVYRELIRRRGGDAGLEQRLAEVERKAAEWEPAHDEPAAAREPEPDIPTAWEPEPEPQRETTPPEVEEVAAPEPVPGADERDDLLAAFGTGWGEVELEADPAPRDDAQEESDRTAAPVSAAPTIAGFLSDLAAWRPGREPREEGPSGEAAAFSSALPTADGVHSSGGGTGSAAGAGGSPAAEVPGTTGEASAEPRSQPLPSDGEFAVAEAGLSGETAESPDEPGKSPGEASGTPAAEDEDDLESFQAWLRSLKR